MSLTRLVNLLPGMCEWSLATLTPAHPAVTKFSSHNGPCVQVALSNSKERVLPTAAQITRGRWPPRTLNMPDKEDLMPWLCTTPGQDSPRLLNENFSFLTSPGSEKKPLFPRELASPNGTTQQNQVIKPAQHGVVMDFLSPQLTWGLITSY